jgi:hypothetical protein
MRTRLDSWLHRLIYFYPFFRVIWTCAVTIFRAWRCKLVRYSFVHSPVDHFLLWRIDLLLGNDSVNTFPRQRIHRLKSDNFLCYETGCKYSNKGRGVSYVFSIYPLLGNDVFSVGPPRDYVSGREQNKVSHRRRMRMERVLGSQGRRARLKIDYELL